jgi:hypothetical protein
MLHAAEVERDSSKTKGGSNLGRGLQTDRNIQIIKSSVPQAVAAFAATKHPGELIKIEQVQKRVAH